MVCEAWAMQGYGTPLPVFVLYALKVGLYVAAWVGFCALSPSLGGWSTVGDWWLEPLAFQKAILWSMLFEVLGLGCGSGPLTGRYLPPVSAFIHFAWPGTTKLPLFPHLPLVGGHRRSWLDAALYVALCVALLRALVAPTIAFEHLLPVAILVPLLGILDKTIFLAARSEHYLYTVLVFAFATTPSWSPAATEGAPAWIAGAKAVQLTIWFFAGVSKLNHHFPTVVCVMTSNSPFTRFEGLRRRMYRSFPDDLRPSSLAVRLAHGGALLEFGVPIVLALGEGGTVTYVGLGLMLFLHGFITSNVPMGVPIEWNVMVVYGAFFLFWKHATVSFLAVGPWPLAVLLALLLVGVPLLGNFFPERVSFLLSMRYYAGNWANSVWFFRGDAHRKLERLRKISPWVYDQLDRFYDRATAVGLVGKVVAFRSMHLHGRVLPAVVPQALDRFEDYQWVDGEIVAGLALGWNFGDGHLHHEQLLAALQAQCAFEPGELRCVFVESQPLFGQALRYRVVDAATGLVEEGAQDVRELRARQPWSARPTA